MMNEKCWLSIHKWFDAQLFSGLHFVDDTFDSRDYRHAVYSRRRKLYGNQCRNDDYFLFF